MFGGRAALHVVWYGSIDDAQVVGARSKFGGEQQDKEDIN